MFFVLGNTVLCPGKPRFFVPAKTSEWREVSQAAKAKQALSVAVRLVVWMVAGNMRVPWTEAALSMRAERGEDETGSSASRDSAVRWGGGCGRD